MFVNKHYCLIYYCSNYILIFNEHVNKKKPAYQHCFFRFIWSFSVDVESVDDGTVEVDSVEVGSVQA